MDCFNQRERTLLKGCFYAAPLYLMTILVIAQLTGCITIEGDDPDTIVVVDDGCDAGVPDTDAAPETDASPDATPDATPVLPRLLFLLGGPPNGTEVLIGTNDADALCFNMIGEADMEIRRFRVRVSAQHGMLTIDAIAQFRDIKLVSNGNAVVAGPADLVSGGNAWHQNRVLENSMWLTAGNTYALCVRMDVNANAGLHNEHIGVTLLPFEQGDVVLTVGNTELPLGQIEIGTGLSSELVLKAPTGVMTYTLAPDDTESEAGIVVGGSTNVVLAKYRFTATGDSLKQTKLRFRLTDVVFDPSVPHGVAQVTLWDGTTLVAGPVPPNGSGYIDFSSFAFVVPQDFTKTLTVMATLNQVGPAGADTGIDVGVTLCSGNNTQTCWTGGPDPMEDGTYEVRSAATNAVVDTIGNSGNIQGRTKILRKTKPTVVLNSLPTSTLSNGVQTIARVTIMADAGGDLPLKNMSFQAHFNNAGGTVLSIMSPTLREVGQGSDLPATSSLSACIGSPGCIFSLTFTSEQIVPAGTSRTFDLRVNVTGADTAGDSISTQLLGDTTRVTGSLAGTYGEAIGTTPHNFIWSDNSAIPHSAVVGGSADWTNGRFVRLLPTDSQTLVRN